MELRERERKVDLSKMDRESLENLSTQLGDKIREICDEAVEKINSILNIYGASAKMQIVFDELPKSMEKNMETPKKKGIKHKKNNLK